MRWLLSGLAFAAVMGLAVATASIRVGNVRLRAEIQKVDARIEIHDVSAAAARERYREATRPDALLRLWREIETQFEREARRRGRS